MKFETKYNLEDYIGKQINYLTPVAEYDKLAKDSSKQWVFTCVCGNSVIETPYRIISGHKKSCGCMRYKNIVHKKHKNKLYEGNYIESFIGKKNNRLKVIGYTKKGGSRAKLECLCDCGNITYVYPYQFEKGGVKSCGCARFGHSECHKGNTSRRTHNLTGTRFYKTWNDMIRRCYNPNEPAYKFYGARGITVCDDWKDTPEKFCKWCEETHPGEKGLSIDRIDGTKGYSPENCRWATSLQQAQNIRSNVNIEIDGVTKCLAQWCRDLDISQQVVYKWRKKGYSHKEAIIKTLEHKRK